MSGLVFPGLGQIILKHYKRGIALMLITLVNLIFMVAEGVRQATAILEKIESGGGATDIDTIAMAAAQASNASGSLTLNSCLLLITLCWFIGVIDAYRLGKKKV